MTQFLREPALFPARIAGETWGSSSCDLELAGERFRIDGLTDTQRNGLADRYGARLHEPSNDAATVLQIFRAPASDFLDIDTRGWEYSVQIEWMDSGFTLSGMRVMARVRDDRAGIWTSVEEPDELSGVIENVLRPLLAARLLATGGLLVHSAAISGYLFAGRSGAGKSTISRLALAAKRPVLSDDLNAIVPARFTPHPDPLRAERGEGSGFVIAPLPFTGDLRQHDLSNEHTPLRAVIALEKGDREELRAMSLAETVSLLVRCAPYVNQDPQRMTPLLDRASEIAARAARGVLTFRRDGNVWPILDRNVRDHTTKPPRA